MLRAPKRFALFALPLILFCFTLEAHAWSFLTNALNTPYDQCMTCHVSNSNLALNAYGQDYLDPTHASRYHSMHSAYPGECSNCHANKGYPIKRSGLDNLDSDGDTYTNLAEFNAGTFPGDAGSYPQDTTAPVISAFSVPASTDSLTVSVNTFSAADNVGVTGYMLTASSVAPAADDSGWSAAAPATYTFPAADIYTLYAWAKDAAGNVSTPVSAQVDTTPSQQRTNLPPTASAGSDQTVIEGDTVILNAVGSTDDRGIIAYSWIQLDGPGGSPIGAGDPDAVILSDSTGITPVFVTPAVDANGTTLTFALTVVDGDNARDTDEVYITIDDNGITAFDGIQGVVSTLTSDGDPIGVNAGTGNACVSLTTLDLQDMPPAASEPVNLLYGLMDFELKVTDPTSSYITVHFPQAVPAGYKWLKYTAADGWIDFDRNVISGGTGEGAVFNADRTQITIYINDNGPYDDDPATGIIQDPGGLASGTTAPSAAMTSTGGSNSFGGSGGGCFISALPNSN